MAGAIIDQSANEDEEEGNVYSTLLHGKVNSTCPSGC